MSNKNPIGYKCTNCGKIHYPKHGRCLECKTIGNFEEVELPAEGSLLTFTILKAPPTGIDKHILNLGIIDLGNVRYTGQIEVEPEQLRIGMRLKANWKKIREVNNKPIFGFVWKQS